MKSAISLTVLAAVGAQAAFNAEPSSNFRDALTHNILSEISNDVDASSASAPKGTPAPSAGSHHSPPIYPHQGEGAAPYGGAGRGPPSHPPVAHVNRRAYSPDAHAVDEGNTVTSGSDDDDHKEHKEHKVMGDAVPTCSTLTEIKTVTQTVTGSPHHSSAAHIGMGVPSSSAAHIGMGVQSSSAAHIGMGVQSTSALHSANIVAETPGSSSIHGVVEHAPSPTSTHAVHSQLIGNHASTSAVAHAPVVSSSGVVMAPNSAYSVIPVDVPEASSSHSSIKLHGSNAVATPSSSAGPSGVDPNRVHGSMAATPSSMSFTGAGAQVAPNAAIMTAFGGFMGVLAFVL